MQTIIIQSLFRKDYHMSVSEDITINQIKDKITKAVYDTPAHNQILLYWGKPMGNNKSIRDYNIKERGMIHLLVRYSQENKDEVKEEDKVENIQPQKSLLSYIKEKYTDIMNFIIYIR